MRLERSAGLNQTLSARGNRCIRVHPHVWMGLRKKHFPIMTGKATGNYWSRWAISCRTGCEAEESHARLLGNVLRRKEVRHSRRLFS